MQIPGQNGSSPSGRQFRGRENALNLCFRPVSVNGEMRLDAPRHLRNPRGFRPAGAPRRSGSRSIYETNGNACESARNLETATCQGPRHPTGAGIGFWT